MFDHGTQCTCTPWSRGLALRRGSTILSSVPRRCFYRLCLRPTSLTTTALAALTSKFVTRRRAARIRNWRRRTPTQKLPALHRRNRRAVRLHTRLPSPSPHSPNSTSRVDPGLPSGPVIGVSVWPQRGPGGVPSHGNGRGTGAGGAAAASASAIVSEGEKPNCGGRGRLCVHAESQKERGGDTRSPRRKKWESQRTALGSGREARPAKKNHTFNTPANFFGRVCRQGLCPHTPHSIILPLPTPTLSSP